MDKINSLDTSKSDENDDNTTNLVAVHSDFSHWEKDSEFLKNNHNFFTCHRWKQ